MDKTLVLKAETREHTGSKHAAKLRVKGRIPAVVYGHKKEPEAISFDEHDRLLDVCYCLRDSSIRRVPVTSDGKVKGIVSRADILKCILELSQETCHAGSE